MQRTFRPLLADPALEREIERLARHLAREHEQDLDFARRPDERHIGHAEALRDQGEPGGRVGYGVRRVLEDDVRGRVYVAAVG